MRTASIATRLLTAGAVVALGASLAGCSLLNTFTGNISRDDTGVVTEGNDNADIFSIKVGDCLNDASATESEVSSVPVVPCTEPHDSEVVESVILEDGDFPGDDAVAQTAESECLDAFEEYIGLSYNDSVYDFTYYVPTTQSWLGGDREILCLVYDPEGQITGTLEGAAA